MMRKMMLMLTLFAAAAGAQVPALATGSRLKIELTNHRRVEGTLLSQTADSLVIAADGARITPLPSSGVGRVKSTLGKSHGAGAIKGTKIGLVVGGAFGALLGLAVMNDDSYTYDFDKNAAPVVFGAVGAVEGAFYGVIIGAIAGAQDWKTVYERPYRVTLAPDHSGVRLGLSRAF
jgi:hypothetical protein